MPRSLATFVLGIVVAVAVLFPLVYRQDQRIRALERTGIRPKVITVDARGNPVLTDAEKRKIDADVLDYKHWELEYEYFQKRAHGPQKSLRDILFDDKSPSTARAPRTAPSPETAPR